MLRQAAVYYKATVITSRIGGFELPAEFPALDNLSSFARRQLDEERDYLRAAFQEAVQFFSDVAGRHEIWSSALWLAEKYDEWQAADFGIMSISTVKEFEDHVCRLKSDGVLDAPPYAEVLMQGRIHDAAFRHPEYMIARDLEFLYGLFLEGESIVNRIDWGRRPEWAGSASENTIALGRAVIQTCFNLLESYVSGLARAYAMEHEDLEPGIKKKLLDNEHSLKKRVQKVVEIVSNGEVILDLNCDPCAGLFTRIKPRRDSFVHCAPGPEPNKFGVVKESLLHDISKENVAETVTLTCQLIRDVWRSLKHRDGPFWLRDLPTVSGEHRGLLFTTPQSTAGR